MPRLYSSRSRSIAAVTQSADRRAHDSRVMLMHAGLASASILFVAATLLGLIS